jgi:NAD(P)-dependent dehydrogenase (short-subunit alcohol dehydrogenase family)
MDNNNKKIAFVSGGSKGIGLAIVLKMLDENYQIITCGRNIDAWNKAIAENARLNEVDFIKTDLCRKGQLNKLFAKIKKKYGRLDAAVNNAAVQILAKGQFADISEDILRKNLDSDLWMPTMCIKKELELMLPAGGSIVNISSISGVIPTPDAAMYSAAKYGLEGLTKTLALELIDKNITIEYTSLLEEIEQRDHNDTTRLHSPLKPAPDAVIIDTSQMTIEDVLAALITQIEHKRLL